MTNRNCLNCNFEPEWKLEYYDNGIECVPLHGSCRLKLPKYMKPARLGWHKKESMIVQFYPRGGDLTNCPAWQPKEATK